MTEYSVVIPAFNAAAFIEETLQSVFSQSVPPAAVILVDDGSQDDTADIVARVAPSVDMIRQDNQGPGAATSTGLARVTTGLVAMLDADDLWEPEKSRIQIDHLAQHPDLDLVFTKMDSFNDGSTRGVASEVSAGWSRSTTMMRTHVFTKLGPIVDMPGNRGEMVDWFTRAREQQMGVHMIDQVLAHRRIHTASLSYGRSFDKDRGYLDAARRAIMRRKQQGNG